MRATPKQCSFFSDLVSSLPACPRLYCAVVLYVPAYCVCCICAVYVHVCAGARVCGRGALDTRLICGVRTALFSLMPPESVPRAEPKYKIKEEFEIFHHFQKYTEDESEEILKQINKANKDELFYNDLTQKMRQNRLERLISKKKDVPQLESPTQI